MNQIRFIFQKTHSPALLPDERPSICAFAGLYDIWKDKNGGKEIHSYSIITTVPNTIVGRYHDRMPVILEKEDEDTWLNPDIETQHLLPLLKPFNAEKNGRMGSRSRSQKSDKRLSRSY